MQARSHLVSIAIAVGSLMPAAWAQDDCSSPVSILGEGLFAYDRTANTNSGFTGGSSICQTAGGAGGAIRRDTFFLWTSVTNDYFEVSNCGEGNDTQISVYQGTDCSATCLLSNDDGACASNGESTVGFVALTNQWFLIQIGDTAPGNAAPAVGDLLITSQVNPINDTCATPLPMPSLGTVNWPQSQMGSSGFSEGTCAGGARDAFFTWTAPASGAYMFSTCGTGASTVITVYEGSDCNATCISWSGDGQPCGFDDRIRIAGIDVGDAFLIQVSGGSVLATAWTGTLSVVASPSFFTGDNCANPPVISGSGSWSNNTTNASPTGFDGNGSAPCAGVMLHKDVFWQWTATSNGDFRFDTLGSSYDTLLNVHQGSGCSATCLGQDDNGAGGLVSRVDVAGVNAGDTFLVQVGSPAAQSWWIGLGFQSNNSGPVTLQIDNVPGPPPNDDCASPTPIAGLGNYQYDTSNATTSGFSGGDLEDCTDQILRDLFLVWTVPADGDYRIGTCNSVLDTHIAAFRGSDCSAICIRSDDDSCTWRQSFLYAQGLQAGAEILIQVGSSNNGHGPGTLTIETASPPPGDDCKDPVVMSAPGVVIWNGDTASTSGFNGGDPLSCYGEVIPPIQQWGELSHDLFYTFTVPCDGDWRITAPGSNGGSARMSVHTGNDCSATCIGVGGTIGSASNAQGIFEIIGAQDGDSFLVQLSGRHPYYGGAGVEFLNVNRIGGNCPPVNVDIICDPARDHYQGNYAKLNASTWDPNAGSELHIEVRDGPSGELGYLLVSAGATSAISLFSGTLCLDGPMARYSPQVATYQAHAPLNSVGVFDGNGRMQNLVGTSASGWGFDVPERLPYTPPGQLITAGDTWYFQVWYRDRIGTPAIPGSSANFSNVARVEFQ